MTSPFEIEAGRRYVRWDGKFTDPLVKVPGLANVLEDPGSGLFYSNRPDGHLVLGPGTRSSEDLIGLAFLS